MIKKVAVIIALVMIASLSVAGCTSPSPSPSPSASSAVSTLVSKNASTAAQGGSAHQAVNISVSYGGSPRTLGPQNATPGNASSTFYLYNVTIDDVNVSDYLVIPGNFRLMLSDGSPLFNWYIVGYTQMLGGLGQVNTTLHPGQNTSGVLVYQVPNNVLPQTLVYNRTYVGPDMRLGEDVRVFNAMPR